jgi:IS30 family transposase
VPAHRQGAARAPRPRARPRPRQELRHRRGHDQPAARRGGRSGRPRAREGDLILGLGSSAIGTLVERSSRFTMLLHLPPMDGRDSPRFKNGPAATGHGAEAVRDSITYAISIPPKQLRRSLTWDQGDHARHARSAFRTGTRPDRSLTKLIRILPRTESLIFLQHRSPATRGPSNSRRLRSPRAYP